LGFWGVVGGGLLLGCFLLGRFAGWRRCLSTGYSYVVQAGQTAQSTQAASPGLSPAKSINMFAFPRNGQNSDQQLKDENDCYGCNRAKESFFLEVSMKSKRLTE
jgi:hypothetical protein